MCGLDITMRRTGVFQGMSLASGCANSGGLKYFRQLKDFSLNCDFEQTSEELKEMPHLSKCDQGWAIQRKGESWKSRSDWGGNKVKQVDVISATWKKRWMTRKYLYTENMKANLSFAAMNLRKTFQTSLLACCKKLKFRVITHKKYIFFS